MATRPDPHRSAIGDSRVAPDVSKRRLPLWGSTMTVFEKEQEPNLKVFRYPFLEVRYFWVFAGTFCLEFVVLAVLCMATGNAFRFQGKSDFPFFGKFFVWPIAFGLLFPLLNCAILGFYKKANRAFGELISAGSLRLHRDSTLPVLLSDYVSTCLRRGKIALVVLLACGGTVFYWSGPTRMFELNTWCRSGASVSIPFCYVYVLWVLQLAVLFNAAGDFWVWTRLLRTLLSSHSAESHRYDLKYCILHPDGAAGFLALGETAFRMYLPFLLLFVFTVVQLAEKFVSVPNLGVLAVCMEYKAVPISIVLFSAVAPCAFALPLIPLHRFLRNARRRMLVDFYRAATPFEDSPKQAGRERGEKGLITDLGEGIKEFSGAMELLGKSPTWPFDLTIARAVIGGLLIPLMLSALQIALRNLL